MAVRPRRYPALTALFATMRDHVPSDMLGRISFNAELFQAALSLLPSDQLRRAASILFHADSAGTPPSLDDRRRAADRFYTGKGYAREPDTIQRFLERDLLDPLLIDALWALPMKPLAGPASDDPPRTHNSAYNGLVPTSTGALSGRMDAVGGSDDVAASSQVMRDALDQSSGTLTDPHGLIDVARTESAILSLCAQMVLDALNSTSGSLGVHRDVMPKVVRLDGHTLLLKIRPDLHTDRLLRIALQDARLPNLESPAVYCHTDISLGDSIGRFAGIRITVPNLLGPVRRDLITSRVGISLATGYSWLREQFRTTATAHLAGGLERECLQLLREVCSALGRPQLPQQIWLVKVVDGRVTYVVDEEITNTALHAGRAYHAIQQAPASIALALLANSIPLENSFSRRAIGARSTVGMTLTATPYEEVNADFLVAQGAIYADRMLLSPLAGDRRGWLLAAYPASADQHVHTVLAALKARFEHYLRHSPDRPRAPIVRQHGGELLTYDIR